MQNMLSIIDLSLNKKNHENTNKNISKKTLDIRIAILSGKQT